MPRKLRIQYPRAIYHVMNRGDQREDIFQDDSDREKFLSTLGQALPQDRHLVLLVGLPPARVRDSLFARPEVFRSRGFKLEEGSAVGLSACQEG